jgi:restriction system protein
LLLFTWNFVLKRSPDENKNPFMAERWTIEVCHDGLGKFRVISGPDKYVVEAKARAQRIEWENRYQQILENELAKKRQSREREKAKAQHDQEKREFEEKQEEAEERTKEAQEALHPVRTILQSGLQAHRTVEWDKLKRHEPFSKPKPKPLVYLEYPPEPQPGDARYKQVQLQYPREPQRADPRYQPDLNLLDKLVASRKEQKTLAAEQLYLADYSAWQQACQQVEAENQQRVNELLAHDRAVWAKAVERTKAENERLYAESVAEVGKWNQESHEYQEELAKRDAAIEQRRAAYEALRPEGIEDYCEMVLAGSEYPDMFPHDFDLEYNVETKILVVEYWLPAPGQLPRLKEVKYIKSKDEFTQVFVPDGELNRLYDEVLYQMCLRTLHELFRADGIKALAVIQFNGWVKFVDKATGKEEKACILAVQAKTEDFQAIKLESVEPKACFKALKGTGSAKLYGLTPVAPQLSISREDKRFVASREVADKLDEGVNLAAMDWEDFEHLIRELFEKEFASAGGEVKITQASRDWGVDAVAFDPDVIRGGKTVIQAKRYTNTVPVSAVRDLWGTVDNERANKGILVTTSGYGPESYEFAKGKPLVLLDGGNLLSLLEKHGHKAKIDLKEAKKILGEQG